MERKLIEKAGEFIKKNCDADDFVLKISSNDNLATRFAVNAITQHITGKNVEVDLEVAYGNQTGASSVNQIDEDSLRQLIKNAQQIAKFNQPDPEYVPSEPAHDLIETDNYSKETEELTVEQIVGMVKKCTDNSIAKGAKVAGLAEKNLTDMYVLTKNGFEGFDKFSTFGISMTMKKDYVETKVSKSVKNYKDLGLEQGIAQLNQQFDSLKKPEKIEAQKIPVILRPGAVLSFFQFLFYTMDLRSADEGVNAFTDQLGKPFFGEKFTLKSTMDDPELSVPRFNGNGVPTRNINWVNKGVLENMRVTRYYAKEKGLEPSFFYNILIEGGDATEEDMMKMVDRGLIVNRLWYIRPVDMKRGEFTGITRDGVLYFEDGKIQKSVNNLRFNEILHEASRRILALAPAELQEYYAKIPTMLIDDFNFVDATTF